MLKKQYQKTKKVAKVTFTLPKEAAAEAKEVRVVGEFSDWKWENSPLMKVAGKEYQTVIELALGRKYEFRYMLDNLKWENDWAADDYVPSPYAGVYNSVVNLEVAVEAAPAKATVKPATKGKATAASKAEEVKPNAAPAKAKAAPKKAAAPKAAAKTVAVKEDLTKIEGVGPKIADLLKAADITSYATLAKADLKVLKGILDKAGSRYKMHDPTTWPKQASLAAAGKWDELKKLQDSLKGGKKA